MRIAQEGATTTTPARSAGVHAQVPPEDDPYADYKSIRRNGAVVGFEPSKIAVASKSVWMFSAPGQAIRSRG